LFVSVEVWSDRPNILRGCAASRPDPYRSTWPEASVARALTGPSWRAPKKWKKQKHFLIEKNQFLQWKSKPLYKSTPSHFFITYLALRNPFYHTNNVCSNPQNKKLNIALKVLSVVSSLNLIDSTTILISSFKSQYT
jgi:hypothetical protein